MHTMKFMPLVAAAVIAACSNDTITNPAPVVLPPQATVLTATGSIATKVDEFRNLLGPSNGGTAGEQLSGRREISWDGAGANPFDNKNDFPASFFNTNVKSGAVFTTAGHRIPQRFHSLRGDQPDLRGAIQVLQREQDFCADWKQPARPAVPGCRPANTGVGPRVRRRVQRRRSG